MPDRSEAASHGIAAASDPGEAAPDRGEAAGVPDEGVKPWRAPRPRPRTTDWIFDWPAEWEPEPPWDRRRSRVGAGGGRPSVSRWTSRCLVLALMMFGLVAASVRVDADRLALPYDTGAKSVTWLDDGWVYVGTAGKLDYGTTGSDPPDELWRTRPGIPPQRVRPRFPAGCRAPGRITVLFRAGHSLGMNARCGGWDALVLIDPVTLRGALFSTLPWPAVSVSMTPDLTHAYVQLEGPGCSRIALVRRVPSWTGNATGLAPDGTVTALTVAVGGDMVSIQADPGADWRDRCPPGDDAAVPVVTPDGRLALFAVRSGGLVRGEFGQLWLLDLARGFGPATSVRCYGPWGAAINPAGSWLLLTTAYYGTGRLIEVNPGTGASRVLATGGFSSFAFSPDGTRLALAYGADLTLLALGAR